jgi:hypothetical protein
MDDGVFQGMPPRRSIFSKGLWDDEKIYLPHPAGAVKIMEAVETVHLLLTTHMLLDN